MSSDAHGQKTALRTLADSIVLRRTSEADTDALANFYSEVFRNTGTQEPNLYVAAWTCDLMSGNHPTFKADDFFVAEDTRAGKIVSSLNLISQTWTYDGIAFGVGRPEVVGTHPDYRRRGLVRALFELLHQESAARGEKVQAITGIPWYYRQFEYEMALELGGGRTGYLLHIPKLKESETEPYHIRTATEADVPFMVELYGQSTQRSLVACVRDEQLWRYDLNGRSAQSSERQEIRIIETPDGAAIGVLVHPGRLYGQTLGVNFYEVRSGVSWVAVTPSVLRYLQTTGEAYAAERQKEPFGGIAFWLGSEHPVYHAAKKRLPHIHRPYAWYIRVPDLPGFLRHLAPVLEKRIADSLVVGYTGELKLSFYRSGLRIALHEGRITAIEPWMPMPDHEGAAAFPDRTFLQVVFGYRSPEELERAFPDCWTSNDEARELLRALFPQQFSFVWPVS